jgi:N-acetylmuramoyl-L-alanine amidase
MTLWLLDAGHGGMLVDEYQTEGKRSPEIGVGVGVHEGEFTRDIVSRIIWLSSYEGLNVVPVVAGATDYSLNTRIQTINWYKDEYGDCKTLSIHANADGYGPWTRARGSVIFHRRDDSLQLAKQMRLSLRSHVGDLIPDHRGIKKANMKILWPRVPAL